MDPWLPEALPQKSGISDQSTVLRSLDSPVTSSGGKSTNICFAWASVNVEYHFVFLMRFLSSRKMLSLSVPGMHLFSLLVLLLQLPGSLACLHFAWKACFSLVAMDLLASYT